MAATILARFARLRAPTAMAALRGIAPAPYSFMRNYSIAPELKQQFDDLVNNNKLVVFMKGTPDFPMCGFSKGVIQILEIHGMQLPPDFVLMEFQQGVEPEALSAVNVLEDDQVRNGIKEYSDWPTIPQVYVKGEFVGGFDLLLQMHQNGELVDLLKSVDIESKHKAEES